MLLNSKIRKYSKFFFNNNNLADFVKLSFLQKPTIQPTDSVEPRTTYYVPSNQIIDVPNPNPLGQPYLKKVVAPTVSEEQLMQLFDDENPNILKYREANKKGGVGTKRINKLRESVAEKVTSKDSKLTAKEKIATIKKAIAKRKARDVALGWDDEAKLLLRGWNVSKSSRRKNPDKVRLPNEYGIKQTDASGLINELKEGELRKVLNHISALEWAARTDPNVTDQFRIKPGSHLDPNYLAIVETVKDKYKTGRPKIGIDLPDYRNKKYYLPDGSFDLAKYYEDAEKISPGATTHLQRRATNIEIDKLNKAKEAQEFFRNLTDKDLKKYSEQLKTLEKLTGTNVVDNIEVSGYETPGVKVKGSINGKNWQLNRQEGGTYSLLNQRLNRYKQINDPFYAANPDRASSLSRLDDRINEARRLAGLQARDNIYSVPDSITPSSKNSTKSSTQTNKNKPPNKNKPQRKARAKKAETTPKPENVTQLTENTVPNKIPPSNPVASEPNVASKTTEVINPKLSSTVVKEGAEEVADLPLNALNKGAKQAKRFKYLKPLGLGLAGAGLLAGGSYLINKAMESRKKQEYEQKLRELENNYYI